VYRMTLVKEHNMKELDNYVELIHLGEPDLIEIKAVTYCGKSDASDLTMQNVPYHQEVRDFCDCCRENYLRKWLCRVDNGIECDKAYPHSNDGFKVHVQAVHKLEWPRKGRTLYGMSWLVVVSHAPP
ncbi:hypothetical protein DYB28_015429, partial [Aphanomyces astaci]